MRRACSRVPWCVRYCRLLALSALRGTLPDLPPALCQSGGLGAMRGIAAHRCTVCAVERTPLVTGQADARCCWRGLLATLDPGEISQRGLALSPVLPCAGESI